MPINFTCACGAKIKTGNENAGKTSVCPACGDQVVVPDISTAVTQPTPPAVLGNQPAIPTVGPPPLGSPSVSYVPQKVFLTIGGVFFLFIAFCAFQPSSSYRFRDDNAMGATANAIDKLAKAIPLGTPAGWIIAVLMCWLIRAVIRLTEAVQQSK